MTLLELAQAVLEEAAYPLTYAQIWESAKKKGLDKKLESSGKTPWQTLAALVYVNIRDKADSVFMIVSRRPIQFWLKARVKELEHIDTNKLTKGDSVQSHYGNSANKNPPKASLNNTKIQDFKSTKQKRTFNERDLHPLLVKFLKESEFDSYAKTIYHEGSSKSQKGKDKWNFPDIVAVHFPFNDYDSDKTLTLAKHTNQNTFKIYSFELKIELGWGNLKECYFQAVSNSSFANEGYLVVFEEIDEEMLEEIGRLNQSFGIGLLQLGLDELDIIFPSKKRELDFATIDMLIGKNPDFKAFIENVNKDFEINDRERIATANYDKILSDEELNKHMQNKKIVKD